MRRCFPLLALAVIYLAETSSLCACSVPVFRYALERWPSDPYRVVIFHRGKLTKQQQKLAEDLGPYGLAGEKHANLTVQTVDLDASPDKDMLALWQTQKNATLPHMVVRYPAIVNYGPAWSGALTESNVASLIDSPARRELVKRILAGQSAVWILLESGRKADDEAAYATLKKQLAEEEKRLKLPEIDEADLLGGDAKEQVAKLRIRFSIIRVSRTDPKERMLVEMLLGSEGSEDDSLRDPQYVKKTMAFPIFGRGRIRYGLVGAGIATDTIHEACAYLVGPCKCQIKQGVENRGMDLVTAVDWKRLVLSTIRDKPAPPLLGLGALKPVPIDPKTTPSLRTPVIAKKPRRSPVVAPMPRKFAETNTPVANAGKNTRSSKQLPVSVSGPAAQPNDGKTTDGAKPQSATVQKETKPAASPPAPSGGESGKSLYRNVFLMFGLVAVLVVVVSLFLARRNA